MKRYGYHTQGEAENAAVEEKKDPDTATKEVDPDAARN